MEASTTPSPTATQGQEQAGSMLDALPSQIAVVDHDLKVRMANRAWQDAHPGEDYLRGLAAEANAGPAFLGAVSAGLRELLAGRSSEFVVEYPTASMLAGWTLLRAAPFAAEGERLVLVAHVDITARKVAERFSRTQHEILSMVTADLPLGTTLERLAGAVLEEAPGAACTIHTVTPEGGELLLAAAQGLDEALSRQLTRLPIGVFGPPSQAASLVDIERIATNPAIVAAAEAGIRTAAVAPARAQRGAELGSVALWFTEREVPKERVLDLLNMAAALCAVALERHHTTWELRERETRLQSMFALHPDAVLILDPSGMVQSINPAAEQLLAETPSDFVGQHFTRVVPANLEGRFNERLRRALTGYPQRFTISIHPRGRSRVEVDMTFVPLLSGGTVGGIYVVAKDITEQLAAAEQIRQSGRQLQQSAKMEAVGRLAGGIAHDFNNLLTAIRGYTDLLISGNDVQGPARSDLLEISRAVDRASSLTRQLLAFSRQQIVLRRVVDLNVVVDEVRSMVGRLLRADTQFEVRLHKDALPVLADPAQIHQIVMNLVVNSQDAMPAGGRLTIETHRFDTRRGAAGALTPLEPGRYAALTVTDTGRGMDQETQAHIFEPFFTTKPPGQGTGLGLSTVYAIVEQSGGQIGYRTAPDQGTRFTIYLPERPAPAEGDERVETGSSVRTGSETVLLAEDDESVRRMVRKILVNAGYTVLEARHGADALLVSREHQGPIDLLLTDVVMPELNGLRLAHILKQERPDTAVIFMSGYARDGVDRQGLTEPGVLFIHKPFSVAELSEVVRSALDPTPS